MAPIPFGRSRDDEVPPTDVFPDAVVDPKLAILTEEVVFEAIESLEPHPANPREGDVGAIVESIRANGFYGAILGQKSKRRIIAGEHRWRAAVAAREEIRRAHDAGPLDDPEKERERLAWTKFERDALDRVPVIWIDVDDDEALRILLVDNRTNDLASYRNDQLASLLTDLAQGTPRGLAGTGFSREALDDLLDSLTVPDFSPQPGDANPRLDEKHPVECPNCGATFTP